MSNMSSTSRPDISLVSPAYRESKNLPVLYDRIKAVMDTLGRSWEWIIVDDHSPDDTFDVVTALSTRDPRVRGVRLARNYSSHTAITCGLHHAQGACAVVLAAGGLTRLYQRNSASLNMGGESYALALRAGDLALTVEDNRIAAIERSAIVRPQES